MIKVEPLDEISDKIINTTFCERQFAKNKNLKSFSTVKKLPGATSVFDLWTEEVTYETQVSFPALMNRSEIVKTKVVRLSPLENAIRSILKKSTEIAQLECVINAAQAEKSDYTDLFNDLSRYLAGTVDSPVNGGVGQYRTFLIANYDGTPEYAYNVRLLRNSFQGLTVLLSRCLLLYGKLVPSAMRGSHETLVELFKVNFKDEIESLGLKTDIDYLPPNAKQRTSQSDSTSLVNCDLKDKRSIMDFHLARSSSRISKESLISEFKNRRSVLYLKMRGVVWTGNTY